MKKTILTGIKPTGRPHLGNYIGAIKPSLDLTEEQNVSSYLFIADCHSLTSIHSGNELNEFVKEVACSWLACGLNPEKTVFYLQSDIPELMELNWILACMSPKGLMNRTHSYKAKLADNKTLGKKDLDDGVSMGLFNYPILMAADILLFSATDVPVGGDQMQHLEIARLLAKKFNHIYKTETFILPKPIGKKEHLLPGLDGRKMSKSYNNEIPLFCNSKKLRKLIMKIQTDSIPKESPKDPSQSILFDLYSAFASKEDIQTMKDQYQNGIGWGEVKEILFESLDTLLKDKREIYTHYINHSEEVRNILNMGKEKARCVAKLFMEEIKKIIGVIY